MNLLIKKGIFYMKKNNLSCLLVFLTAILFTGCGQIKFFERNTQLAYNLSNEDVKNIQYYISSGIMLRHKEVEASSKVTGSNKIKKDEDVYQKNVIIFSNTPGIATDVQQDIIYVQFSDDIILTFKPESDLPEAAYTIFSINGEEITDGGSIKFRGSDYTVHFGDYKEGVFYPGGIPKLQFKLSYSLDKKQDNEIIKGKKL
jgi:hypothetical protein